ncbi:MAG: PLP-dependent transferase [Bacteroidota bacterium]
MSTEKFPNNVFRTEYISLSNPTNDILEKRLAALEGGIGAIVTASGTAAIATTLLVLLKAGDHIVASNSLYGGTYNLLKVTLPRLGITTTFVDTTDPDNFKNAAQENTRVFFVESLGNLKLDLLDLKGISAVAKSYKVPFIVDNTVASPYLLNPIQYGADVVIHSLTKYVSGNGTSIGGVIIDAGNFDWTNGKFPEFTERSISYNELVYHETFGNTAFIAKVRIEGLSDFGAALSPLNAFQILQGLETLPSRIIRHSSNALDLAQWLEEQEEVDWVNYPGLKSGKQYDFIQNYLKKGQSGELTFGLKEGFEGAKTVVEETRLFSNLANNGQTKSLIVHPASTAHKHLSDEEQLEIGVSKDLIQLSVGLEDIEDLKADLKRAFENIKNLKTVLK